MCKVTANTIIVVFFNFAFIPSGLSSFKCKCGIKLSNSNKNNIPKINPIAAGSHSIFPCSFAISIDGIINDHTDAAIITPDANPNNNFSTFRLNLFFIKNTIADPKVVPKNGIANPIVKSILSLLSYNLTKYSRCVNMNHISCLYCNYIILLKKVNMNYPNGYIQKKSN